MVNKTLTFKLNNLSNRKKNIIDDSMLNYSIAIQYLLDKAYKDIKTIEEYFKVNEKYTPLSVSKWVNGKLSKEINKYNVEPFKDSLKLDFGLLLSTYLNKKKINKDETYPLVFLSKKKFNNEYNLLMDRIMNSENENINELNFQITRLLSKKDKLRPIYFCRTSTTRDFCLLYDKENNKYFAKLFLLNVKSNKRKKLVNNRELFYINNNGNKLNNSGKNERFIIVPLAFGKWQEEMLKKSIDNPEIIRTARLYKNNDNYYLSVNFKLKTKAIKTITYMGLTRGINSSLCYNIVDKHNIVIYNDTITESRYVNDDIFNMLANQIANIAYKYKAQMITLKFSNSKGDKLVNDDMLLDLNNYTISQYIYKKLIRILDNKLKERNLPKSIKVSPVGIYYECPKCESSSRKNRISNDIFICIECGNTENIDELGSYNVATKINKYKKDKIKIQTLAVENGYILKNNVLGLNLYIKDNDNISESLEKEISRIIFEYENSFTAKSGSYNKTAYSMIQKIISFNNIIDAFEFE